MPGRVVNLSVAPQSIRLLPVDGVVSDLQLLFRHPQGNYQTYQHAYDGGDHDVPADDETAAHYLFQELDPAGAAVEAASRREFPSVWLPILVRDLFNLRSDANKASDHSLNGSDDGWLVEENDVETSPDKEAGGGADVGVEDSHGGVDVCTVRVAAIEAGPPHP
nr:hypothetical protein Ccrd_020301 [Ipomoea batatas]